MTAVGAGPHLEPTALEARAARSTGPWSADHLIGLLVANGFGLVLVVDGWWEASGLGAAADQLPWLNVSVLGLVIAGSANGLWLARGRRVVTLARQAVLPAPLVRTAGWSPGLAASGNGTPTNAHPRPVRSTRDDAAAVVSGDLLAGSRMSRYHRASCLLVTGKQVERDERVCHEQAGRGPCEVCQP